MLFVIMFTLTKYFDGLSPFEVYRQRYIDVIKMYAEVIRMDKKEEKMMNPNRVIRRPAGDDWF